MSQLTYKSSFNQKVFFNLSKLYKMTSTQNISMSLLVYPERLKRYIIQDEKLTCIWYIKLNTRSNFWTSFIKCGKLLSMYSIIYIVKLIYLKYWTWKVFKRLTLYQFTFYRKYFSLGFIYLKLFRYVNR